MKQAIKLLLIYFGYQILFSALMLAATMIGLSLQGNMPAWDRISTSPTMLGWALLLSAAAMIWHLVHFKYVRFSKESFRNITSFHLLECILCIFGAMLFCNALSELFPLPNLLENDFISLSRTFSGIMSIALIAPVAEELLFRGAIMGHFLRVGRTPKFAIVISALIFGIIHINPAQVPFAFLMGLVFGWLYYRTGSLLPVVAGHVLNNTLGVIEMALLGTDETIPEDMVSEPMGTLIVVAIIGLLLFLFSFRKLNRSLPPAMSLQNSSSSIY